MIQNIFVFTILFAISTALIYLFFNTKYDKIIEEKQIEIEIQLKKEIQGLKNVKDENLKEIERLEETLTSARQAAEENVNVLELWASNEYDAELDQLDQIYWDRAEKVRNNVKQLQELLDSEFAVKAENYATQLNSLSNDLETQKRTVSAINNDIRLAESNEMQEDYYKLQLSQESIEDIDYLLSIEHKINNKETLRKLIWSTYLQPAFNDMTKRVLNNSDPKGIYKITDDNGKAYIGRSTKIKNRWREHIKSSLGIGSIAHYGIHDGLRKRGWQNFTFEVLEEYPREIARGGKDNLQLVTWDNSEVANVNLPEREKFYINFYETNIYGYNKNTGG